MAKDKKRSWIVTITATVEKEIVTVPCTEEEARNHPYDYADDEMEIGTQGWRVENVEPNE